MLQYIFKAKCALNNLKMHFEKKIPLLLSYNLTTFILPFYDFTIFILRLYNLQTIKPPYDLTTFVRLTENRVVIIDVQSRKP